MIQWDRVLANLRGRGFRAKDIARMVGVTESAVHQWLRGEKEPGAWLTVMRLLDAHYDHCPDRHRPEVIGWPAR